MRRNDQCVHLKYGVDVAINAGNFMYFIPILKLLQSPKFTNDQKLQFSLIIHEELTCLHLG